MAQLSQTPTSSSSTPSGLSAEPLMAGRLSESADHVEVRRLDHVPTVPDHWLARRTWWVRERFQAITGIGLAQPSHSGATVRRHVSPPTEDMPRLGYVAAGDPEGRRVLFVHGTPGEATDWSGFLREVPAGQYRIAVDRPGFGESGPGAPVVALSDQARAISALLASDDRPAVVVGSSYGGPVALSLAAQYPQQVAGVILVGAAADPAREQIHPLQRFASARLVERLMPEPLRHSNAELFALRRELEFLGTHLHNIRARVTILQGMRDTLVPAENAHYLADKLIGAMRKRVVFIRDVGHFLHLLHSDLVEDALNHMIGETSHP